MTVFTEIQPSKRLTFQFMQDRLKPIGQGTLQLHRAASGRVDEFQTAGVEALTGQAGPWLSAAINGVSKERVPHRGQMNPDLVGTSCFQAALHMGKAAVSCQYGPVRYGGTAGSWLHRHPFPIHRVTANRGVYGAAVLPETSHRYRLIHTSQGVVLKLSGQGQMRPVIFGGDDQAGGVPVDAVDDARAQLPVDSR